MERLTKRIGEYVFISDEKYPDIVNRAYKKLADYEDAEEQGLLIKLPCKPNEEVWIGHDKYSLHKGFYACKSHILSDLEDGFVIGRTKEEAEKALEMESEHGQGE